MTVRITVGGHPVIMTRAEARQIRDDLTLKINTTPDFEPKKVKPPKINRWTGLLEREQTYAFFDQFYESTREVRKRGGTVYSALTQVGFPQHPIAVYCTLCRRPFRSTSCKSTRPHSDIAHSGVDIVDAINHRRHLFSRIGEKEQQLRFDMGLLFKHLIQ